MDQIENEMQEIFDIPVRRIEQQPQNHQNQQNQKHNQPHYQNHQNQHKHQQQPPKIQTSNSQTMDKNKIILYSSFACNALLMLALFYVVSLPRPTLEQQILQVTQTNKQSWEQLQKIKKSTEWNALEQSKK